MGRIEDEQRHVQQTSDLHLATIEALARAIDAKDQTTQSHIRRVQIYAAGLAKAVGLSADEIQGVKTAALLHDIGKLAVPEHILSKPGPLTPGGIPEGPHSPAGRRRDHRGRAVPVSGRAADPQPPRTLGRQGLSAGAGGRGDSDRRAHSDDRRLLRRGHDRAAVSQGAQSARARSSMLEARGRPRARSDAGRRPSSSCCRRSSPNTPCAEPAAEAPRRGRHRRPAARRPPGSCRRAGNAFENIALAHREIYALYEIAQSMGTSLGVSDTMALISSKLTKIVPWSGCALFLYAAGRRRCCAAASPPASTRRGCSTPRWRSARACRAGWRATAGRSSTPTRASSFEAAGISRADRAELRDRLPAVLRATRSSDAWRSITPTPNCYTEDHRRLLERVAEQAGAVIHNSIVFEQTQEDSLTDPLTGAAQPAVAVRRTCRASWRAPSG